MRLIRILAGAALALGLAGQTVAQTTRTVVADSTGNTAQVAAGRLKVDGSGVTQPVSGSVSVSNLPSTQPVSGTVAVSNLPSTQPVSGSITVIGQLPGFAATPTVNLGTTGTVPVSASALPLPSGAATAANQATANTALSAIQSAVAGTLSVNCTTGCAGGGGSVPTGTAGSPNAAVVSVQGVSGGTAVAVSASALPLPSGASSAANQTSVQSSPGTSAGTAVTVQGSSSGVPVPVAGSVGGYPVLTSSSFTTTSSTSAWSANQLIADNATAGSVTVMNFSTACRVSGGSGYLFRARIKVASDTGFAGQSVILKLYKSSPTLTNGDRATWLTTESNYIGQMSVALDQHFSDYEKGIGTPSTGNFMRYDCTATSIYGLLVSSATITPQAGSKAVTVVLEGTND